MALSAFAGHAAELPESLNLKPAARILWDFEAGKENWVKTNDVQSTDFSKGALRGTVSGSNPYLYVPYANLDLNGAGGVAVRIWLSAAGPLQLYWANENGGFASSRMVETEVPANQWTTVWFDLSTHPEWSGRTINNIRIDPGSLGITYAIECVAILDQFSPLAPACVADVIHFDSGLEGWTQSGHVKYVFSKDGRVGGTNSGTNPYLASPALSYTGLDGVMVQMKSTKPCDVTLYWTTVEESSFNSTRSATLPLVGENRMQRLMFNLADHPGWAGKTISRLRIDPGDYKGPTFEIDDITLLSAGAFLDADGDQLSTIEEAIYRTNPAQQDSIAHRVTEDTWQNTSFYSTNDLVRAEAFYRAPTTSAYTTMEQALLYDLQNEPTYFSTRHRGYLTAPVTGNYRFWVTGSCGVELHLSTSDSKYAKRLIAQLNPEAYTGYGVKSGSSNYWDNYVSQMSEEVHLLAGEKYYLECIRTSGHTSGTHVGIAWALPGEDRRVLSTQHLESYYQTPDDADDDYLPDAWEAQHGLDPQDNGLLDINHQGERGDFDSDGLNNREEFLLGTDPANPDSDGDGLTDSVEVRSYHTDPTHSDAPSGELLYHLQLDSYTAASSPWTQTDDGLVSSSFRGNITWNFSVPEDGFWLLDVTALLSGDLYLYETVDTEVLIDGYSLGDNSLLFGLQQQALLRVFTPYIAAGDHTLELRIKNTVTRRQVGIDNIAVIRPNGADLDADGIPDWIMQQLHDDSSISYASSSRVSPATVEGTARMRDLTTLDGNPVQVGTGDHHWFGHLPLNPAGPTAFAVDLEPGVRQNGTVSWTETNVMEGHTHTAIIGQSFKLVARPLTGATGQPVTLSFRPPNWNGDPNAAGSFEVSLASDNDHYVHTFPGPGSNRITAIDANGQKTSITVWVRQLEFSTTPRDLMFNKFRTLTFSTSKVHERLHFDGGQALDVVSPFSSHKGLLSLEITPHRIGGYNLLARLTEDGPIGGVQPLNIIALSDAIQNNSDFTYFTPNFPGYRIIRSPLVMTGMPDGAKVVITIFRAGVTFLDGSTSLTLTASDFTNGFYNLEFLYPDSMPGGYCHYIEIYDRDGNYLGKR